MIQLTEKLWLDNDRDNWIVGEKEIRISEAQGEYEAIKKPLFFSTIPAALKHAAELELRMGDYNSWDQVLTKISELREMIDERLSLGAQEGPNKQKLNFHDTE